MVYHTEIAAWSIDDGFLFKFWISLMMACLGRRWLLTTGTSFKNQLVWNLQWLVVAWWK
jgi:hypothetical protein